VYFFVIPVIFASPLSLPRSPLSFPPHHCHSHLSHCHSRENGNPIRVNPRINQRLSAYSKIENYLLLKSRSIVFLFNASLLSYFFFPLPTPISNLINLFFVYTLRGITDTPLSFFFPER
jgi:hypothetical protein